MIALLVLGVCDAAESAQGCVPVTTPVLTAVADGVAAVVAPVVDATATTIIGAVVNPGETLLAAAPVLAAAVEATAEALPNPGCSFDPPVAKHSRAFTLRNSANGKTWSHIYMGDGECLSYDGCKCQPSDYIPSYHGGKPTSANRNPECKFQHTIHQGHWARLCYSLGFDATLPVYVAGSPDTAEPDTMLGPFFPWDPTPAILQDPDESESTFAASPTQDERIGQEPSQSDIDYSSKDAFAWYDEVDTRWYMPWSSHRSTPEVIELTGSPYPCREAANHTHASDDQDQRDLNSDIDVTVDASAGLDAVDSTTVVDNETLDDSDSDCDTDHYEDAAHQEMYVYFQYNTLPMRMRGKGK